MVTRAVAARKAKKITARRKVLMLIPELQMGGAAKVVRELATGLRERVDVVEAVFNSAAGVDFPGSAAPISLDVDGGGGPAAKVVNLARRVSRARRLKRRQAIDVSISHLEGAHWVDVLSRGREKVVLCVHGSILHNGDIRGAGGWLRARVVTPLIYNRAERVVAVSQGIAEELAAVGVHRDKLTVINNGFDLATIERSASESLDAAESQLFEGAAVLITVGRLAEQKNHAALLEVFADLRRRRPCRLLIAGDGPLRSELLAKARTLGLRVAEPWSCTGRTADADVIFLGVQANPFRFVSRADLYVMTSGWEGFPLSLCEAMACGTPVVTTDCPTGPSEILAPERLHDVGGGARARVTPAGVLMPLLNLPASYGKARESWVDTLASLLDDPDRKAALGAGGRERVEAFSRAAVTARWFQVIEDLCC